MNAFGLSIRAALGLCLATLAGCDEDDSGRGTAPSTDLCTVINGYIAQCGDLTPCERSLLRDCKALQNVLSPTTTSALTSCVRQFGAPPACLGEAVEATPATPAFESYVSTLCLECGGGVGECQDEILAGDGNAMLQRMSRLARVLQPPLMNGLARECTVDDTCGEPFEDCAVAFIGRYLPPETAECLVETVLDGAPEECIETGGEESMASDGGSTTGEDPEPVCTEEGCPCLFNEECDTAAGLGCLDNFCTPIAQCVDDAHEVNDSESQATGLPGVGSNDNDAKKIDAELNGDTDVDWFTYVGEDRINGLVNPTVKTNVGDLELCVYALCKNDASKTKVTCPSGTTKTPSDSGMPGCCGLSLGQGIELDFSGCTRANLGSEDGIVYARVSGGAANMCQPYTLTYHY